MPSDHDANTIDAGTALIMACCSDLAGQVRGKGFPARDLDWRLSRGIGWTPANVQITCFNTIADSDFGSLGDMVLIPDPETRFAVRNADDTVVEDAMLGDIKTLDGSPWEYCTRSILKAAVDRLDAVAGLQATVAFEHEFQLDHEGKDTGSFSLAGARAVRTMGERLFEMMTKNGLTPDTFMKEYGADQYEVTLKPAVALRAADQAVILRELTRIAASEAGRRATFTPMRDPEGVGNGVHIHISLSDSSGVPVMYDPAAQGGLSAKGGAFVAGITGALPESLALLAPSVISHLRLTPHRWSASYNNLAKQDREAAVRICPVTTLDPAEQARQFHIEIRAGDAAASPHLQLAALLHAGADGLEQKLPAPPLTEGDLSTMSDETLSALGCERLPTSLEAALARFEDSARIGRWFGEGFRNVYLAHKREELRCVSGMTDEERCARYESAY